MINVRESEKRIREKEKKERRVKEKMRRREKKLRKMKEWKIELRAIVKKCEYEGNEM